MSKWIVGQIFYNEADIMAQSISSVYDFADKIILVEGKDKLYDPRNTTGLSTDGSTQLVENLIKHNDPQKKIVHVKIGLCDSKKVLRQCYLDYAQDNYTEDDWILVLDSDELYTENTLKILDLYATSNTDLNMILNEQFWFWSPTQIALKAKTEDMYPEIIGMKSFPGDSSKYFLDRGHRFSYHGYFDERIFRNLDGLSYNKSHSNVVDSKGEFLYSQDAYRPHREFIFDNWAARYHYGYIKSRENILEKTLYYGRRDDKVGDENSYIDNHPYLKWIRDGRKNGSVLNTNPPVTIVDFQDSHLDIMKNHKFLATL